MAKNTAKIKNELIALYNELKKKHGAADSQWRLWCKRLKTRAEKEEVIIGAILTQNTNWRNVEKAMDNLKKHKVCSLKKIHSLAKQKLAKLQALVRPAGFFRQKSGYLVGVADFFVRNYPNFKNIDRKPPEILRARLLDLKGVGPETADSILLYALAKPIFVIDEYTRRLAKKIRLSEDLSYGALQKLFEDNFKKDYKLYQDFHALIVVDGKFSGKDEVKNLRG